MLAWEVQRAVAAAAAEVGDDVKLLARTDVGVIDAMFTTTRNRKVGIEIKSVLKKGLANRRQHLTQRISGIIAERPVDGLLVILFSASTLEDDLAATRQLEARINGWLQTGTPKIPVRLFRWDANDANNVERLKETILNLVKVVDEASR